MTDNLANYFSLSTLIAVILLILKVLYGYFMNQRNNKKINKNITNTDNNIIESIELINKVIQDLIIIKSNSEIIKNSIINHSNINDSIEVDLENNIIIPK